MNTFWWCCTTLPSPDPPQSFPEWRFAYGTVVHAPNESAAHQYLDEVTTKKYYASETLPGRWDVQFDEYVTVENIEASGVTEAVNSARWFVLQDAGHKIRVPSASASGETVVHHHM